MMNGWLAPAVGIFIGLAMGAAGGFFGKWGWDWYKEREQKKKDAEEEDHPLANNNTIILTGKAYAQTSDAYKHSVVQSDDIKKCIHECRNTKCLYLEHDTVKKSCNLYYGGDGKAKFKSGVRLKDNSFNEIVKQLPGVEQKDIVEYTGCKNACTGDAACLFYSFDTENKKCYISKHGDVGTTSHAVIDRKYYDYAGSGLKRMKNPDAFQHASFN